MFAVYMKIFQSQSPGRLVEPPHRAPGLLNPKLDLLTFIRLHAVLLKYTTYLALGF